MGYRLLHADEASWRLSKTFALANTDLARQLGADNFGARLWRLEPGQTNTRHRHRTEHELYILLEGRGRIRIGGELLTLERLDMVLVEPRALRQVFNDTPAHQLWLIIGVPQEALPTTEPGLAQMYPDGRKALPPELS
jgi:quercetin dioxygenase-like cupin family protein